MERTFYHFVLTFRGGADDKAQFAEAVFHDHSFPKQSTDFDELSEYIELQQQPEMTADVFDAIWALYH